MDRPRRHRLPRPTRLLALVVTLLVGCGVVLAAGTAAASGEDETTLAAADRADGSGDGRGGADARGKGDGRGDDGRADGRDNDRTGRDNDGRDPRDNNRDNDRRNNDKNRDNNNRNDNRNNKDDQNKDNQNKDNQKNDDEEFPGRDKAAPPSDDDFIDINDVPPDNDLQRNGGNGRQRNGDDDRQGNGGDDRQRNVNDVRSDNDRAGNDGDASKGSFVARCGVPDGHRNSDNFMVTPGKRNGAQHVHNYVGNLSTDANSDDDSLHAAGTSCDRDNKSTFFWPVLRDISKKGDDANEDGGGLDGNFGKILQERTVDLRFLGNAKSKVEPMPDDLTIIMGDAKAKTNGSKNANAQWTCSGFENRITDKYPLCPAGSRLVRILEFPSCWDGENLDSADHRSHVAFPDDDGSCKDGFKTIPRLRETITYDRPNGRNFALDTFPDQQHDPSTDHSDFMNIVPDALGKQVADCINSGRNC